MRKGTACESESIVTVHWFPANCNIRSPHLKFCFAKEGCSHLNHVLTQRNSRCFTADWTVTKVSLLFAIGYFSENLFKKFCRLFVSWLICSCDVQKRKPHRSVWNTFVFSFNDHVSRGRLLIRSVFSVPASGRSMHPPDRSKGFPNSHYTSNRGNYK